MEKLARSVKFWSVLLGVAASVIVGCAVLLATGSSSALWFTMFGSICTIVVCVGNIVTIRRHRSRR
jgi:energy-converting hydrogenase Eha subunit C